MRGSNSRPSPCKGAALPTELIARTADISKSVRLYYLFFELYQYLESAGILATCMMEIQCLITGKVQGVGYRNFVESAVAELGLFGYVKNNEDGSVSVLAQGEPDILRQVVEYLHEGSLLSKVEGVSIEWGTAKVTYDDFKLL